MDSVRCLPIASDRLADVTNAASSCGDGGIAFVLPVRADFCFGGGGMLCWPHPRECLFARRLLSFALGSMAVLLVGADAQAESRSVGVASANFRTGPSTSRPILYTADRYYPVQVVRCDVGWCETRDFEGDRAWVAERLLSEQPSVVVNVDRVNVRHGPTTRAKVLFRVDWGEALKVTERKDEWLEIEDVEGERGWVYAKLTWGLPDDSASNPEAKPEETDKSEAKRAPDAKRDETDESEAKRAPDAKRDETDESEAKRAPDAKRDEKP